MMSTDFSSLCDVGGPAGSLYYQFSIFIGISIMVNAFSLVSTKMKD